MHTILPKWLRFCLYLSLSVIAAAIFLFATSFNLSNQPKIAVSIAQIAHATGNAWYYSNGPIFGLIVLVGLIFIFEGRR